MLTPHVLPGTPAAEQIRQLGMFREALLELVKADEGAPCLYLHNYSQPPRIKSFLPLSWQLVVGLEEEIAVSSLWGRGVS